MYVYYLFKPVIVCKANICLPPGLEIENVHAICPCTFIRVKILCDQRMGEVEIALEPL